MENMKLWKLMRIVNYDFDFVACIIFVNKEECIFFGVASYIILFL